MVRLFEFFNSSWIVGVESVVPFTWKSFNWNGNHRPRFRRAFIARANVNSFVSFANYIEKFVRLCTRLFDSCGFHFLLNNWIKRINQITEKKLCCVRFFVPKKTDHTWKCLSVHVCIRGYVTIDNFIQTGKLSVCYHLCKY